MLDTMIDTDSRPPLPEILLILALAMTLYYVVQ